MSQTIDLGKTELRVIGETVMISYQGGRQSIVFNDSDRISALVNELSSREQNCTRSQKGKNRRG